MKVFSINPNSGKYFEDDNRHLFKGCNMYQGAYNYTPIFPLYTFSTSGRFNYISQRNTIEFYTMLPVNRIFKKCLVEIHFRFILSPFDKDSLSTAISKFIEFCEESKNTINIGGLIS